MIKKINPVELVTRHNMSAKGTGNGRTRRTLVHLAEEGNHSTLCGEKPHMWFRHVHIDNDKQVTCKKCLRMREGMDKAENELRNFEDSYHSACLEREITYHSG